jgi:hypothetical protein
MLFNHSAKIDWETILEKHEITKKSFFRLRSNGWILPSARTVFRFKIVRQGSNKTMESETGEFDVAISFYNDRLFIVIRTTIPGIGK